jgi:predicted ester cyclase
MVDPGYRREDAGAATRPRGITAAGGDVARDRQEVGPMSREQTEQTMRRYLDALVANGDFAAHFADDVVWMTMETGEEVRGRDGVRDLIVSMHAGMFEAVPELGALVCGDGIAALEAVFVARHVDEFAGIPADGARVRLPYTVFYELDGDQITVLRAYLSIAALVAQLQPARSMAGER